MNVVLSGSTGYERSAVWDIPPSKGVYIIHDLRGPLYIGKATNLQRRFQQHWNNSHNLQLNKEILSPVGPLSFSWIESYEADKLERKMVRFLKPKCNRIKYTN